MATAYKVLALDISTRTGCCWDGPDGQPVFRTLTIPHIGGLGGRFRFLCNALLKLVEIATPDLIAVEEPLPPARVRRSHPETDRLLITLAAAPHYVAAVRGLPCTERNTTKIKRHWASSGRADKTAMLARCKQLGWVVEDDNQADAAGLWSLIHSQRDPRWNLAPLPLFIEAS